MLIMKNSTLQRPTLYKPARSLGLVKITRIVRTLQYWPLHSLPTENFRTYGLDNTEWDAQG